MIGKRSFGWVACGNINAKNRMGGYVGVRGFHLLVDTGSFVTIAWEDEATSECDSGYRVPVNPELIAASSKDKPSAVAALSVADELRKLAELRDKGIITTSEFDTQKAKLLSN